MDRGTLDKAIEEFWGARGRGVWFPPAWADRLDLDDAYRIQLALVDRRCTGGVSQVGWKVGLTAKAIQDQFKVHEPVFGCLLSEGRVESGRVFRHDDLIQPGFENEICITLGTPLRGPGITFDQARAAISEIAPALEIVEKRGNFSADLPLTMADNAQQKAFVTGTPIPLGDIDLSRAAVTVYVDDAVRDQASGAEVMGNPINSIVWLANKLAEFGRVLDAGHRVISGSFTRQYPLDGPARVRSVFEPVGVVEAVFV